MNSTRAMRKGVQDEIEVPVSSLGLDAVETL